MAIDYLEAAVEIAREAGAVLREEAQRPVDISYKGDYDLVTQADKRSEAVIVSRLQKYFPGHAVAAEEGTVDLDDTPAGSTALNLAGQYNFTAADLGEDLA